MAAFAYLYAAQGAVSASTQTGQSQLVTVTVAMQGNVAEAVVRALVAQLGLRNNTQVAGFNLWAGFDLAQHALRQLQGQRVFTSQIDAARRQRRAQLTIQIAVALPLVNQVRQYLSLPPAAASTGTQPGAGGGPMATAIPGRPGGGGTTPPKPVARMSSAEKIAEAIRRALPMLPADVREEVESLLSPESLAIMAGVLIFWVASHFFGVGEVADVVLLVVGVAALGGVALTAARELYNFASTAINATREEDLDRAAKYFSDAVALIGVQAVMAILLKRSPKVFRKPYGNSGTITPPMVRQMNPPRAPGKLFYRPKITADPTLPKGEGYTNVFGDVFYSSRGSADLQKIVRVHEKIHSLLSPKLQILREVRVALNMNSYNKSFILRYLEEALAETAGQISVNGFRGAIEGITFPVKNGYVTIAAMRTEAIGIVLGPINVGGMVYKVVFRLTKPSQQDWQEVKPTR